MDTLRQQLSEERNKREELEATLRERNAELGDGASAAKRREDKLQSKYDSLKRTLESLQQSRAEEEQRNKQLVRHRSTLRDAPCLFPFCANANRFRFPPRRSVMRLSHSDPNGQEWCAYTSTASAASCHRAY